MTRQEAATQYAQALFDLISLGSYIAVCAGQGEDAAPRMRLASIEAQRLLADAIEVLTRPEFGAPASPEGRDR